MQLEEGYLYHIYNQGNNRQKIFFSRENYLFFLKKIRTHILPFADILAWCLMPNHFHLMVYVREDSASKSGGDFASKSKSGCDFASKSESGCDFASKSESGCDSKSRPEFEFDNLNKSIGIMLASYTRAINKQENRSGSLFRKGTKAECLNCPNGIAPSYYVNGGAAWSRTTISEYPTVCFRYIHENPVKARLCKQPQDWEFSSAADYFGQRNGRLINRERAKEYIYSMGEFESPTE